ncbi:hypothetical protein NTE_01221 [Candidatus Nitrososphaera evergladensis SR1]|uniref:Uncharacterized protein n=1 Tax=Candidatus Nitrososphaera evergladensis SR1 TaxID=1459636 RepID=A0A075MQ41_9ARCH|nr:hypothetical protein [Candidatus Nitrososphaera evergladensis]AIF83293.1 hypothetical protein NTE_01221 [Candidatus Nitrososphaera evergladensis SR1]
MGDLNSFNPDDIPASKKTRNVVAGDINVGKKSPAELEQGHIEEDLQTQVSATDSIFSLQSLDDKTQRELAEFAGYYYERGRITQPSIQVLIQYHFQEIMERMRSEYQSYIFNKQLEEMMMKKMGVNPDMVFSKFNNFYLP